MKKYARISILMFLATVGFFSCKLPTPPKWDTEINIPIGDGTFSLRDMLEDLDFIKLDSIPEIWYTDTLDTMKMGEEIEIIDSYQICRFNIGNFHIEDLSSTKVKMALQEIWPDCPPGSSKVPVPASVTVQQEYFSSIPGFEWGEFSEGEITLRIRSFLNLPIDVENIIVRDTLGTILVQDSLSVSADSVSYSTANLSGLYVTKNLIFEFDVNTPGTGTDSVWVSPNDSVLAWVESQSPLVDSANALIPEMGVLDTCKVGFATGFETIDSLELKEGILNLTINNETKLSGKLAIDIPSIGFNTSLHMDPQDGRDIFVPLQNKVFRLGGKTILDIVSHFTTDSSFTTLTKDDSLLVQVALTDLKMQSIAAIIGDTIEVDFTEMEAILDLPTGAGIIEFGNVYIRLRFDNAIDKFYARLNLGISANEYSRDFAIHFRPGVTDTTFDVADIVNAALTGDSTKISIDGKIFVFDSLSVRHDDYVVGDISIGIPFRFALNAGTIYSDILEDTTTIDSLIAKSLTVALLSVDVKNRFPIGMGIRLVIAHESDTLSKTFAIPAAPYNPMTGTATGEADTSSSIGLDEGEAYIFTKKPRYEWFELYIPGTGGDTIAIQSSDYIKVGGWAKFKIRVGEL